MKLPWDTCIPRVHLITSELAGIEMQMIFSPVASTGRWCKWRALLFVDSFWGCRTALQLRSNVTDGLVGQLAPLRNLRELSLRGCTGLTGAPDSGFARITALTRLECLDISNCKVLQVRHWGTFEASYRSLFTLVNLKCLTHAFTD